MLTVSQGKLNIPAMISVMVLLSCGDAGDQCQTVPTMPASYASAAACNAAVNVVLPQQSSMDYPVIAACCQPAPTFPRVQMALAGR
jgi:hypothetical protein